MPTGATDRLKLERSLDWTIFTQAEPDHGRMVSYLGHEWTTMLNAYQRGQSGQRESEPPLRENKPPTNYALYIPDLR